MAQIVFSSLLLITANSKQLEVKIQSLAFFYADNKCFSRF